MSAPHHRADVQGLRAVAVLLVVAFHVGGSPVAQTRAGADWALAPSGFVGVDVFFVISGFVITALLLRGVDRGEGVPFRDFYARRARRIMPALALMSTVVLAACVVVLDPFGAQQFAARTAVAANALVANVYLYRHTGYFDASAATNPFLHTWSLSVEEQTYLVLPAALGLAVWFGRRRRSSTGPDTPDPRTSATALAVGAGLVAVTSFTLAMALHAGWRPFGIEAPQRLAFLAAPTRWWEFAAGALVALAVRAGARPGRGAAAVLGSCGLVAVVGSGVLLDPGEAWPSAWTLVPVLGAAAVVLAGASGPAGHLLSWRPLTWLGDRSYAWYLWHWPAIVLAVAISPTTSWLPAAAAVGSLLPAWASYRWVERPIRVAPRIVGRRAVLLGGGCVLLTVVAAGAVLLGARGGWGLEEADGWYDLPNGRNVGCHQFNRDATGDWPAEVCTTRLPGPAGANGADGADGGRDTVLVLGDLQADGAAPATVDAAGSLGYRTAQWSRSGCPFLTRAPVHGSGCEEWQRGAWELVERLRPAAVVLAADEAAYTTAAAPEEELAGPDGGHPGSTDGAVRSWATALEDTLGRLRRLGVGAVVVGGAPDLGPSFPRDRQSLLDPDPTLPTIDRRDAERRRAAVWRAQQEVVDRSPGAAVVDPVPLLCTPRCDAVVDGRWRFYERNQLTNAGSAVLTDDLRRALERVTSTDATG